MKKLYTWSVSLFMVILSSVSYAYDDITPEDAYEAVETGKAYILDVRTDAEFIWVGHPDVQNVVNISYKIERKGEFINNPSFVSDVNDIFEDIKNVHIITMCRSGQRSVDAAKALDEAGYTHVSNMLNGFQGDKDPENLGYRTINGWMNSGLPGHTSSVAADDYYDD